MTGSMMELRAAIRRNDVVALQFEVGAGAPVNEARKADHYETVLQVAAGNPLVTLDTLRALVESGADPKIGSREISSRAATTGQLDRVKYFEGLGCPILGADHNGYSLLHRAIGWPPAADRSELVDYLLSAGVDPNLCSKYNEFPIGSCLIQNEFEIARKFVNHGGTASIPQWSPIVNAILFKDIDTIRACRAEVNHAVIASGRWFPIQIAVRMGDLDIVDVLCSLGADLSVVDYVDNDLFVQAVEAGHLAVIQWAFDHVSRKSFDSNQKDKLHYLAAATGSLDVPRWLIGQEIFPANSSDSEDVAIFNCATVELFDFYLDLGADINAIGCGGSPLMNASCNNRPELVKHLIQRGADVNWTRTNSSALHSAVSTDSDVIVDMLISAGAQIDIKDLDWDTPLCYAGSLSVARRLIAAGADPNYKHPYSGIVRDYLLEKDVAFSRIFSTKSDGQPVTPTQQETLAVPVGSSNGSLMELWAALRRGDVNAIKAEIEAGVSSKFSDEDDDESSETILVKAAGMPSVSLDSLMVLIDNGAYRQSDAAALMRSAARTGDVNRVKFFENLGCPIIYSNLHGYTVLHDAILGSPQTPYEFVEYALGKGVDPNQATVWNETATGYCLSRGFFDLACSLISRGAMRDFPEWPAILSCVICQDREGVIANHAQKNQKFFSFGTWYPIQVAVRMGSVPIAQLLRKLGARTMVRDFFPFDIVLEAVSTGKIPITEWALAHSPKRLAKQRKPESIHYFAAASGSVELVEWLIEQKIEPGATAIMCSQTPDMIDFYVDRGLDVNYMVTDGTPLIVAAQYGNVETVRHLLTRGANPSLAAFKGTALHFAVASDADDIVDLLIAAGAPLDALDSNGDSPICLSNSLLIARKLIDAGVDVDQEHWVHGTVRNYLLQKDVAFGRIL